MAENERRPMSATPKTAEVTKTTPKLPDPPTHPEEEGARRLVSGAWLVYHLDEYYKPVTSSPHADELEARRAAMDTDLDTKVVFTRWGQNIEDALEGRKKKP